MEVSIEGHTARPKRTLRNLATDYPNDAPYAVHIEVTYASGFAVSDPRCPESFDVKLFRKVADLNAVTDSATASWTTQVANVEAPAARLDLSQEQDVIRREALMRIRNEVIASKWSVESRGDPYKTWSEKGWLPPPEQRPYGYLDYIIYETGTGSLLLPRWDQISIGPGRLFAEAQRVNVEIANRYTQIDERKGECWSDAASDPVQSALTSLGTETGIEIDHIIPKVAMGPNIYSNAQVTSAHFNRSKGRS